MDGWMAQFYVLYNSFSAIFDGWMDGRMTRFYVLYNSFSAISGRWAGDTERVCATISASDEARTRDRRSLKIIGHLLPLVVIKMFDQLNNVTYLRNSTFATSATSNKTALLFNCVTPFTPLKSLIPHA